MRIKEQETRLILREHDDDDDDNDDVYSCRVLEFAIPYIFLTHFGIIGQLTF